MAAPVKAKKSDDILLVQDFWDLPLSGVTTFEGAFHAFQRVFDEEAQAWSKSTGFRLQPLTGMELAQFNELHALFLAWRADYDGGNKRPHPQLPEALGPEADRYKELYRAVDAILHGETERTVHCTGKLTLIPGENRYVAQWKRS
jgi:hypothetical protein